MDHHVMDPTGHSTLSFEKDAEAQSHFDMMLKAGYRAAKKMDDGVFQLLRQYEAAEETIFFPQLRGG